MNPIFPTSTTKPNDIHHPFVFVKSTFNRHPQSHFACSRCNPATTSLRTKQCQLQSPFHATYEVKTNDVTTTNDTQKSHETVSCCSMVLCLSEQLARPERATRSFHFRSPPDIFFGNTRSGWFPHQGTRLCVLKSKTRPTFFGVFDGVTKESNGPVTQTRSRRRPSTGDSQRSNER